ncbi:MAG: hypothetical protein WCQ50_14830 [Spirochaetota bacterium]
MSVFNDSYLYRQGASAQTKTVISSRFKIFSHAVGVGKFVKMGVTSSFNISESRTVEAIRGLGYGDQIAELVPGVTQPMSITVTRTALYLANIMQMFGYKAGVSGLVRSLKHHKWPFDIKTEIVFSELASEAKNTDQALKADVPAEGGLNNLGNPGLYAVVTVYEGCWMESYTSNYQVEQAAVAEDATIQVSDIFDANGSVYGEFIDSGLNRGDATGRSIRYQSEPR